MHSFGETYGGKHFLYEINFPLPKVFPHVFSLLFPLSLSFSSHFTVAYFMSLSRLERNMHFVFLQIIFLIVWNGLYILHNIYIKLMHFCSVTYRYLTILSTYCITMLHNFASCNIPKKICYICALGCSTRQLHSPAV